MDNLKDEVSFIHTNLQCNGCGSVLHYAPGTTYMQCTACGHTDSIEPSTRIFSFDYNAFLHQTQFVQPPSDHQIVICNDCGSKTTLNKNSTAENCAFCSSPLVIEFAQNKNYIKPHYILPFKLDKQICVQHFQKWLKGLFFAPNNLSAIVNSSAAGAMRGIYIPYWMYDSKVFTHYRGKRGEYYYTTETYTVQNQVKTRRVRHTNWYSVSGSVECYFKDILIPASKSLPEKMLNELTPWHLEGLQEFDERYVSGFSSESYQLSPEEGLTMAQETMQPTIKKAIKRDIGGDEQRILNWQNQYNNTIKYVLLPVWASSYTYNNKVYQFIINAYTGEVIGKHPNSIIKIAALVCLIIAVIAALVYYISYHQHG